MVFLPRILQAVSCASMLGGDRAYPRSVVNDHCPAGVGVLSWGRGIKDSYVAATEKQKNKMALLAGQYFLTNGVF